MIKLSNVSFQYDGKTRKAVDDISFEVQKGEWVALVGHNGSGKTTLAKLLMGLLTPSEGEIIIGELKLSSETVWDVRKQMGMVFQNPDNQFVGATVQDDVAFGLENAGVPRPEMVERVQHAIRSVKIEDFLNQEPHQLSGGQKQRVALASVLALRPNVILLDEATSMLDPMGKVEVLETVNHIREEQEITILSITHDLEEAALADRILVLNQGKLFANGKPNEIFANGESLKAIGLDLPFATQLAEDFRKEGLELASNASMEGLVEQLCKFHSKM